MSVLLQAADASKQQQTMRSKMNGRLAIANCQVRPRSKRLSAIDNRQYSVFEVVLDCGSFILFLGKRLTGDSIFTFNPPAKINKLTPLRTEGTKRIVFPLYRLTAGWTFHGI